MYNTINSCIFIKDNSVGSEPDVDQLLQWGKFVYDDEIKQASVILLLDSVWRLTAFGFY